MPRLPWSFQVSFSSPQILRTHWSHLAQGSFKDQQCGEVHVNGSRTWRIEMASIQVELTKLDNLAEGVLCPSGSKGLDFVTLFAFSCRFNSTSSFTPTAPCPHSLPFWARHSHAHEIVCILLYIYIHLVALIMLLRQKKTLLQFWIIFKPKDGHVHVATKMLKEWLAR